MYQCPVCGWNGLDEPPKHYNICECCGTEFDNDDFNWTHEELRQFWINTGYKWWFMVEAPPPGWDGKVQLMEFLGMFPRLLNEKERAFANELDLSTLMADMMAERR